MTEPVRPAVFLERRSYRRRRMMDALRILPVVGVFLWMLPLFWPTDVDGAAPDDRLAMSDAVIYVFVVWALLILASLCLAIALRASGAGDAPGEDT